MKTAKREEEILIGELRILNCESSIPGQLPANAMMGKGGSP